MELIDKRESPQLNTKFDDLLIGDCYQDAEGSICIKTGRDRCIYYDTNLSMWHSAGENTDELIIPLRATFIVER